MFSNARNVIISGNATFTSNIIDPTLGLAGESLAIEQGMEILRKKVAVGAIHNSGERFNCPNCHPGTRVALQDDVYRWLDEPSGGLPVTWLYGPAGAGKSAIAQTIAQRLHAEGRLTASFFFSRRERKGRGDELALAATLAYQLSINVPATKPLIAQAVRKDPLIFGLSLDDQVQALLVHPLTTVHQDDPEYYCPMVIVALIKGLTSIPQRSQKLFITSRPEHNIVATFKGFKPELVRKMELNDEWKPDDDIWTFLQAGFAEIRTSHPYFEDHPTDKIWPTRAYMHALVSKCSGQFIYASVVLKYIKSDDYYDPTARLKAILQLKNNADQPYADLDALYQYIFSQIPGRDIEKVLTVLSLHSAVGVILPDLVGARVEEIKFRFRPLASLLILEGNMIRYMHASLPDFLIDSSRSNSFCINSLSIASKVVRRALDLLQDKRIFMRHHLLLILLKIPPHYSRKLSPDEKTHIHSMVSGFSFVEHVLRRICNQMDGDMGRAVTKAIGLYFEWIFTESRSKKNSFECREALARPLSEIQVWLTDHLAYRSFHGLDVPDEIDLWPFITLSTDSYIRSGEWGPSYIGSLLEICWSTTSDNQLLPDTDIELSYQMDLLYCLLPHIPLWSASTELLGRHALTQERYATAFLRLARFILRLPPDLFREVLTDSDETSGGLSCSMSLARLAFAELLELIPGTVYLYFVVLFIHCAITVRPKKRIYGWSYLEPASSTKLYLRKVRKKFPILSNPTSPEHIQARANAENMWVEMKGDVHIPVSSIPAHPSL